MSVNREETMMTLLARLPMRAAIVVSGCCVVGALGLPLAQADTPADAAKPVCTIGQIVAAHADSAPKVVAYLVGHPGVAMELASVATEPKQQRRADVKAYFAAHPDDAAALKAARSAERALRQQCRIH